MPWRRWVKPWEEAVEAGQIECDVEQCDSCGELPEYFRIHERRERSFLVLVEQWICGFSTYAIRWKCPLCGATFTMLPPFGLPRKRYVKETVLRLSEEYLSKPEATYRGCVKWLGYGSEGEAIDERKPSNSRAWEWIRDLGKGDGPLRRAKRLIRSKDVSSPAVGRVPRISPRKYRSEGRHKVLQVAWSVLQVEREFLRLFGLSLFPRFGTTAF